MVRSTRDRGRAAEDLAAGWLEARGFEVLARNHAIRGGEVDLVCREGETICFVEVRSRASLAFGTPAESVDRAKARRVVLAAQDWAARHRALHRQLRFDVVSVDWASGGARLALFRGAFDAGRDAL